MALETDIQTLIPRLLPPGAEITKTAFNVGHRGLEPDAVIVIPARNEAEQIGGCLASLALSVEQAAAESMLIVVVNNSDDGTDDLAARETRRLGLASVILSISLPPPHAHVGQARGFAMDLAAALAGPQTVLMTTDADTQVGQGWVRANIDAVQGGAALVCGAIALDEGDEAALPELMRANGAVEARYLRKMRHLESLIDPDPHNAWPHHGSIGGASMAVARSAYVGVGGLPRLPCSEDRALLDLFRQHDLPVAFSSQARVVTSGRFAGRAPGGLADTLTFREQEKDAPLDIRAEPALDWHARLQARALARFLHRQKIGLAAFMRVMGLEQSQIARLRRDEPFGSSWIALEGSTRLNRRKRLRPSDVPREEPVLDELVEAAMARQAAILRPAWWQAVAGPGFAGRPGREADLCRDQPPCADGPQPDRTAV